MAQKTEVVTNVARVVDRASASKEACLVVIYGFELGRKFNLDQSIFTIGRSSKSDIQIDQESVSRHHARIDCSEKAIVVRDLGSTNGTYVNDEPVSERALRDGDLLKIGRTIFKFLTGGNIEGAYHEEIYRLTTTDGLTQVFNKRYFLETLERELSRSRRYQRPLSLIMFDIDHFKAVNDTNGHLAGDHVLKHLATVVRHRVRREDVFSRYGGEEFALILPETDLASAHVSAEKIRKLVEKTSFKFEDAVMAVTISVGVVTAEENEESSSLIKRADDKMYEAKRAGRNNTR